MHRATKLSPILEHAVFQLLASESLEIVEKEHNGSMAETPASARGVVGLSVAVGASPRPVARAL
jgi:hypothetical protein